MCRVPPKPVNSWAMNRDRIQHIRKLSETANVVLEAKWHFSSVEKVAPAPSSSEIVTSPCVWKPTKDYHKPSRSCGKKGKDSPSKILADIAKLVGKL